MDDQFNPVNKSEQEPQTQPAEPQTQPAPQKQYTTEISGAPNMQNAPSAVPSYTPDTAPTQLPTAKKSKGKIVFIALICISVIISAVAIVASLINGTLINNKTTVEKTEQATEATTTENTGSIEGADADLVDSPTTYSPYTGEGTMTPEQIYEKVKKINVGILVYFDNDDFGEGSGIIVSEKDGYTYIITAAHVIYSDDDLDVQVQFYSDTEDDIEIVDAEIVGLDNKTDIGVVRVKKTGLTHAQIGNSDNLSVGQKVYAIGNPGGTEFFGSFTSGIVSAIDRPVPSNATAYDLPCIQHNAAINPGNSGGALVNEFGQVIGLNSSKIAAEDFEGMGFSVPSNTMVEVYEQILENGYVTNRPKLGISYAPLIESSYASYIYTYDLPYGSVIIADITQDSDLAQKGVKSGDIITAVNGKELKNTDELVRTIEKSKVGNTIELTVFRESTQKIFTVKVKLVEDKGRNS